MTTHQSSCPTCGPGSTSGECATAQEAQQKADAHNRIYYGGQKVAK